MYANSLLLLSVIIMPFFTAAVAEYIQTDMAQPAITLYCGVVLLTSSSWNVIGYITLYPESLYKPGVHLKKIKKTYTYTRIGFCFYALAFLLSFWFPLLAFTLVALSYIAWLVLGISLNEEKMLN